MYRCKVERKGYIVLNYFSKYKVAGQFWSGDIQIKIQNGPIKVQIQRRNCGKGGNLLQVLPLHIYVICCIKSHKKTPNFMFVTWLNVKRGILGSEYFFTRSFLTDWNAKQSKSINLDPIPEVDAYIERMSMGFFMLLCFFLASTLASSIFTRHSNPCLILYQL